MLVSNSFQTRNSTCLRNRHPIIDSSPVGMSARHLKAKTRVKIDMGPNLIESAPT